jgi:hypothetical protein
MYISEYKEFYRKTLENTRPIKLNPLINGLLIAVNQFFKLLFRTLF